MFYVTWTCDVCSPSPIHVHVVMGGGGDLVPTSIGDLGLSASLELYV